MDLLSVHFLDHDTDRCDFQVPMYQSIAIVDNIDKK